MIPQAPENKGLNKRNISNKFLQNVESEFDSKECKPVTMESIEDLFIQLSKPKETYKPILHQNLIPITTRKNENNTNRKSVKSCFAKIHK